MLFFIATTVALEVSFAVGWWVLRKSARATYYATTGSAIVLYNTYQNPPNWLYKKESPQLALTY